MNKKLKVEENNRKFHVTLQEKLELPKTNFTINLLTIKNLLSKYPCKKSN